MWWTLLAWYVEFVAFAVYLGGALVMELVWRPAQAHLPMSQIGVACQQMGRRYRWVALTMLGVIGAVGLLQWRGAPPGTITLSTDLGRTLVGLAVCWALLVATVGAMGVYAHPALHVRMPSRLDEEARAAARAEVARAIRRMDVLLRIELAVALVATLLVASLPFGGL